MIRERSALEPAVATILGSGLGGAAAALEEEAVFSYAGLPGLPPPSVPGHEGRLVLGRMNGVPVAAFLGRVHFYEGHPMSLCALPVRVARLLGASTVVLTGAVGALDPALAPGTVVIAQDHINLMGEDPLRGWKDASGAPTFVSMVGAYDADLAEAAERAAKALGVPVARAIYLAVPGPSYETTAEAELMRLAGATVVGMSVVPETAPARALGMRVLGLFVVANAVGEDTLHEDVERAAEGAAEGLGRVLAAVLSGLRER